MAKIFKGSYPVLVTAFLENGEFDEATMRRFVDWQVEQGSHGLITLGSMSEYYLVNDEERTRIIKTVVEAARGRLPVLAGTMNVKTEYAVRYSKEAQDLGADGLMIMPPVYLAPFDDEIFDYYAEICRAVKIPIMLYNNPFCANVDMSAALVSKLAHTFENIRYIKEASGDLARVYDIKRLAGDKMNVWQGARPFEAALLGSTGWVSPEGNFAPRAAAAMYDKFFAGDVAGAEKIRDILVAINDAIRAGQPAKMRNGLGAMTTFTKAILAMIGQPVGNPRLPMMPVSRYGQPGREALEKVRGLLAKFDSLSAKKAA